MARDGKEWMPDPTYPTYQERVFGPRQPSIYLPHRPTPPPPPPPPQRRPMWRDQIRLLPDSLVLEMNDDPFFVGVQNESKTIVTYTLKRWPSSIVIRESLKMVGLVKPGGHVYVAFAFHPDSAAKKENFWNGRIEFGILPAPGNVLQINDANARYKAITAFWKTKSNDVTVRWLHKPVMVPRWYAYRVESPPCYSDEDEFDEATKVSENKSKADDVTETETECDETETETECDETETECDETETETECDETASADSDSDDGETMAPVIRKGFTSRLSSKKGKPMASSPKKKIRSSIVASSPMKKIRSSIVVSSPKKKMSVGAMHSTQARYDDSDTLDLIDEDPFAQ